MIKITKKIVLSYCFRPIRSRQQRSLLIGIFLTSLKSRKNLRETRQIFNRDKMISSIRTSPILSIQNQRLDLQMLSFQIINHHHLLNCWKTHPHFGLHQLIRLEIVHFSNHRFQRFLSSSHRFI